MDRLVRPHITCGEDRGSFFEKGSIKKRCDIFVKEYKSIPSNIYNCRLFNGEYKLQQKHTHNK